MALVISRKSQRFNPGLQTKFRVGDDVIITILGWKNSDCRIAIEAPPNVAVHREEVYQRMREEIEPGSPIVSHAKKPVSIRWRRRLTLRRETD